MMLMMPTLLGDDSIIKQPPASHAALRGRNMISLGKGTTIKICIVVFPRHQDEAAISVITRHSSDN